MGKLVAYGGFSASNYLSQPYNSDLDFGTGDFAYSMWFKKPDATAGVLLHRSASESSDGNWLTSGAITQAEFNGTYLQMRVYTNGFGGGTALQLDDGPLINNTWTHFVFLRSGGKTQAYTNGVLQGSIDDTNTATNTSAKLWVGNRPTFNNRPFNGSIALFRISATAPSPEQILKIYNDEKHLFTEGAQATLYGSSDSVTALAYDTDSELLHVGTSAGRSVFQGLRRVDNTTTSVTSAISASNGLVADE